MDRFMTKFKLVNNIHPIRARNVGTEAAIAAVDVSVTENSYVSTSFLATRLRPFTTSKILR